MAVRRKFAIIVVLLVAAAAAGAGLIAAARLRGAARPHDPRYNVLLVTLDTTRADHLHCYGFDKPTSPNLDALAADGVRFDLAISTSAITPISHASILTGLNPDQHGLRVFYGMTGYRLTEEHPTLATILKSRGWSTAAFVSAYSASERFGLHWGFDTFQSEVAESVMSQSPTLRPPHDGYWLDQSTASAQRRADATTDQVLIWLKKAKRPFFLWTHYFDPHDPSLVPPESITRRFGARWNLPDAQKLVYDAEIYFMDLHFGRLIDYLKQVGEYDRTVIIAVADHGQGLGDHQWFPHRLLYQEQIRLPLIVRLPKGPRGRVIPDLVRSIDIFPTVLEVLDIQPPDSVAGVSLCGLMRGEAEPPRTGYAEALNTLDVHTPTDLPGRHRDLLFCLVDPPWKLIYHKNSPENSELYNLSEDPKELTNLAGQSPEEVARLAGLLEQSGAMQIQIMPPSEPMDADGLRKLRSLGYVGDAQ